MKASEVQLDMSYRIKRSISPRAITEVHNSNLSLYSRTFSRASFTLVADTIIKCIVSSASTSSYSNARSKRKPQFKIVASSGDPSLVGKTIILSNHSAISLIGNLEMKKIDKIPQLTRSDKAQQLRSKILEAQAEIKTMNINIVEIKQFVTAATIRANALERFASDKEALASMLAEAIATGGDSTQILKIVEGSGLVVGTDKEEEPKLPKMSLNPEIPVNERFSILEFT